MPLLVTATSSRPSPEEVWTAAFNKLSQQVRLYFVRPEPHLRALAYMQALMSSAERKNGWQVAEALGGCRHAFAWSLRNFGRSARQAE
jgi:hypothetical protein